MLPGRLTESRSRVGGSLTFGATSSPGRPGVSGSARGPAVHQPRPGQHGRGLFRRRSPSAALRHRSPSPRRGLPAGGRRSRSVVTSVTRPPEAAGPGLFATFSSRPSSSSFLVPEQRGPGGGEQFVEERPGERRAEAGHSLLVVQGVRLGEGRRELGHDDGPGGEVRRRAGSAWDGGCRGPRSCARRTAPGAVPGCLRGPCGQKPRPAAATAPPAVLGRPKVSNTSEKAR